MMKLYGCAILFYIETAKSALGIIWHCLTKRKGKNPTKIGNRKLLNVDETNRFIYNGLLSNEPFLVARFGSGETSIVNRYLMTKYGIARGFSEIRLSHINAIIPKTEETMFNFAKLNLKYIKDIDLFATWFKICEPYLIKTQMKGKKLCRLGDIEPYFAKEPWTLALARKKVLVVSPFIESIRKQYAKRELLFKRELLPDFELIAYKSVMIIDEYSDERFSNWFDALQYMYNDITKIDFDIAILGCGPFGFPLGAMIKELGRKAIVYGGVTQILFGIKGKRWDSIAYYKDELYNQNWIYPIEQPQTGTEKLDDGCYWK